MHLSPKFLRLILRLPAFESINRLFKEHGNFLKVKIGDYQAVAEKIKVFLEQNKKTLEEIKEDIHIDGITRETLKSFFDPNEQIINSDDKRREKTLNTVLVYANIPKNKWPEFYLHDTKNSPEDKKIQSLYGYWYVYRIQYIDSKPVLEHEKLVIKRTVLQLQHDNFIGTKLYFKSLYNEFSDGEVEFAGDLLIIKLRNQEKSIEISSNFDEKLSGDHLYLNAILRSTIDDNPFAKHCILAYVGKEAVGFNKKEIVTFCHSSQRFGLPELSNIKFDIQLDPVIEYLKRKSKVISKPFNPPLLDEIEKRNSRDANSFYNHFEKTYSGKWYSISIHHDQKDTISVKEWTFSCNKLNYNFTALCEKNKDNEFVLKGDIIFLREKMMLEMQNVDDGSQVRIIANIINEKKLQAITTLVSSSMSFREIFIRKTEVTDLASGNLTMEEFIKKNALTEYEKYCLVDEKANRLKWPPTSDEAEKKINDLERFSGDYLVYIPNFYDDQKQSISQLTVVIDKLGRVTEKIKYNFSGEHFTTEYFGEAELLYGTLRLSNESDTEKKSEYIFQVKNVKVRPNFLLGITLDTDHLGTPCADVCIAVRKEKIDTEFIAKTIDVDSEEYQKINALLEPLVKVPLIKYFFEIYPSIRDKQGGDI